MSGWKLKIGIAAVLLAIPTAYTFAIALVPCSGTGPAFGCRACDLVTLAQNVINFLLFVSVLIAVLLMSLAGFKAVMSGGHHASEVVVGTATNILFGILLALAAWLIVDTCLKILMENPDAGPTQYGFWNAITCIPNPELTGAGPGGMGGDGGGITSGPYTGVTGGGQQCDPANTSCSVEALKALGYTDAQANTMSCIAMTESTGNPNAINPNGGACGTFQTLPGLHFVPSSPVYRALPSACQSQAACRDASCNMQAAYQLSQNRLKAGQSAYGDWTCLNCNPKAHACVAQYDPGR